MAGSLKFASHQRGIVCCICAEEIPLEVSKANERGEAVHEECYVRSTTSGLRPPENWLSEVARMSFLIKNYADVISDAKAAD
jgi:hypothetical protein